MIELRAIHLARTLLPAIAGLLAGSAVAASVPPPIEQVGVPAADAWAVYRIFEVHCVDCHGGHLARPKGDFGHVLDLRRLVADHKIRPGDPGGSDLFYMLETEDREDHMPPFDSDTPQLTTAEIETVRTWIAGGASIDPTPAGSTEAPAASPGGSAAPEPSAPANDVAPLRLLGRLHPVLVHFPIALLLCAFVAGLGARLGPARMGDALGSAMSYCAWIGALAAPAAAACGWLNARFEGFAAGAVDTHRALGLATTAAAWVAIGVMAWTRNRDTATRRRAVSWLAVAVLGLAAILVALAGHTGGLLAYGRDYFGGW